MTAERVEDVLQRGVCGRLATVSGDGWPYVVPLLYIWKNPVIYFHTAAAPGHLRQNIDRETRACFEIDEAGQVFVSSGRVHLLSTRSSHTHRQGAHAFLQTWRSVTRVPLSM